MAWVLPETTHCPLSQHAETNWQCLFCVPSTMFGGHPGTMQAYPSQWLLLEVEIKLRWLTQSKGMILLGRQGMKSAISHAPKDKSGRTRFIFYAFPHVGTPDDMCCLLTVRHPRFWLFRAYQKSWIG